MSKKRFEIQKERKKRKNKLVSERDKWYKDK